MGLWGPEAAVTEEEEEEAGARRSGPGLAGRRLRGKGRHGRVASPAGRPDTLSRRGAGERAGCLGAGDRGLRHSDRHSPLGRGRAAPGMATSRQTASPRTRMDYLYSCQVEVMHSGKCSFHLHPGPGGGTACSCQCFSSLAFSRFLLRFLLPPAALGFETMFHYLVLTGPELVWNSLASSSQIFRSLPLQGWDFLKKKKKKKDVWVSGLLGNQADRPRRHKDRQNTHT